MPKRDEHGFFYKLFCERTGSRGSPLAGLLIVALLIGGLVYVVPQTLRKTGFSINEWLDDYLDFSIGGGGSESTDYTPTPGTFDMSSIPEYSGTPYVEVNQGIPYFTQEEITTVSFEQYGELDELGRCTEAFGCYGYETVPTGEVRGDISKVHPSGWKQAFYTCVDDGDDEVGDEGVLWNRCHLAMWAISGENDNPLNLVTGTRYMNVDGMLPWETKAQNCIYQTDGHIMYRITPVFFGDELVCRGVLMECLSAEDNGASLRFCVFCYNVQPGIEIDYATGESEYTGVFLDTTSSSVVYSGN